MTVAQQIFAIAPAFGEAHLSPLQKQLLAGKAKWLSVVQEAGLPVVPTICLTRAAWNELQDERKRGGVRLRNAWVATLFRLVGKDSAPPSLVVRTSALRHSGGLMRAKTNIPAPVNEADSVEPNKPLARAIEQAFASYGESEMIWGGAETQFHRDREVVIVQAQAEGDLIEFASRNAENGKPGPAPMAGHAPANFPPAARDFAQILDSAAGMHMACLAEKTGDQLRMLSARPISASAAAELEAAVDRVNENFWSPRQAVANIDAARLPQLLHPHLESGTARRPVVEGVGVSPGAAGGAVVFTSEDAARYRARGQHCVLIVMETGPNDIEGLRAATGILTARGGPNSHAAIVARVFGKPCVADVRSLQIAPDLGSCTIGETVFSAGDRITIDGNDGAVYAGHLPLERPHIGGAMGKLLEWSDGSRTIEVRTNAETVESARTALSFGAEGIGLARSEHMFFSPERMLALRRMILSESDEDRKAALEGLVAYQRDDYAALFEVMEGRPVTVRLFDPPLHEFLPRDDDDIAETAVALGIEERILRARLGRLAEANPMLGHRGSRLAVTYPEILDMQMHTVLAGARLAAKKGPVKFEIMVPFVSSAREVLWLRRQVESVIASEASENGLEPLSGKFGTMIELPRAALRAGDIAPNVDFISFGTNDLTQTSFGISRDDATRFLADYQRKGLYDSDPFLTIDQRGVGELIKIAIQRGRAANPDLVVGICGEHAGDPASIRFFSGLGIDYVSCSPYRVPIARLVLAQGRD